jgi:tetratricopeptide (TPR) repeat protein
MSLSRFIFAGMLLFSCACVRAAMDDSAPNENVTRRQIDKLIKEYQDGEKKATLGMVQEAISLSISFGAPTYNQGDHESCFRFYAKTAKALCVAFPDETLATPAARASLLDLKAALERSTKSTDVDRNAWSMRFAFDRTQLACTLQTEHIQGLVEMGSQYFKRAQYEEAQDAYQSAATQLAELEGQRLEEIAPDCRFAPMALANAQFAQKNYKEAVASIQLGLKYFPNWPSVTLDPRGLHRDPAEYEDLISDLEDKAKKDEKDTALQFLLGYEYHFTGKRAAAKAQFEKTMKLEPDHAAAKLFLDRIDAPKPEVEPRKSKAF